jgi:hypothetical protein
MATPRPGRADCRNGQRTDSGYVFGGLSASRRSQRAVCRGWRRQYAWPWRGQWVFSGGLSGVAFGPDVGWCRASPRAAMPVSGAPRDRRRPQCGADTGRRAGAGRDAARPGRISLDQPQEALDVVRATLVGLVQSGRRRRGATSISRTGNFGSDVIVRHIIGLDPAGVVWRWQTSGAGHATGFLPAQCAGGRGPDLTRICAEIREELEPAGAAGGDRLRRWRSQRPNRRPTRHAESRARFMSALRGGPRPGARISPGGPLVPAAAATIVHRRVASSPANGRCDQPVVVFHFAGRRDRAAAPAMAYGTLTPVIVFSDQISVHAPIELATVTATPLARKARSVVTSIAPSSPSESATTSA